MSTKDNYTRNKKHIHEIPFCTDLKVLCNNCSDVVKIEDTFSEPTKTFKYICSSCFYDGEVIQ